MTEAHPCAITKELSHKLANMALICSFFVVFIHTGTECTDGDTTWWLMHLWKNGLCRIAVPFFFIASGFFLAEHCLEDGWWSRESQKRVRSLLVPYLIWCTVYFLYSAALTLAANVYAGAELSRNLPASLSDWLNIYGIAFSKFPYYVPLWYVRWLLILMLCSGAFVWILKKGRVVSLIYLCVLLGLSVYFSPLLGEHPFLQIISLSGIFFFNCGLYLRFYAHRVEYSKAFAFVALVVGMALFAFVLQGRLTDIGWARYLNMLAILLVLVAVWRMTPAKQWNSNLAGCAFPIYLLHSFILAPLGIAKKNIPALPYPSGLAEFALNGVITIVGSIVVALLFRKFFPKTAAVFFGGR